MAKPTNLLNWNLLALLHDKASELIKDFIGKNYEVYSGELEKEEGYFSPKNRIIDEIRDIAQKNNFGGEKKILALAGEGGVHHYTYALCRVFADPKSDNYGYIHFDAHDDTGSVMDYFHLGCASFVHLFLEKNSRVKKVFYVGCFKKPQKPVNAPKDFEENIKVIEENKITRMSVKKLMAPLKKMPEDVYVSMDLDVLRREEIYTKYGYGPMTLSKLINCLEIIKKEKNIIGADVLGYHWRETLEDKSKSLKTYKEIVDCLVD